MSQPTGMGELDDAQEAQEAIKAAFQAISRLPHGDGYPAQLLAQAQEHLAAAVTALREWECY